MKKTEIIEIGVCIFYGGYFGVLVLGVGGLISTLSAALTMNRYYKAHENTTGLTIATIIGFMVGGVVGALFNAYYHRLGIY